MNLESLQLHSIRAPISELGNYICLSMWARVIQQFPAEQRREAGAAP
jgi:hypothetical protein